MRLKLTERENLIGRKFYYLYLGDELLECYTDLDEAKEVYRDVLNKLKNGHKSISEIIEEDEV